MLPNILKAVRILLANANTPAGPRVDRILPSKDAVKQGAIRIRRDGGVGTSKDLRIDTARIVVESWHGSEEAAYKLSREADGVLIPNVVNGYHGLVQDVKFEGVFRDSGPSYLPDPDTDEERYIQSFLISYTNPY